MGLASKPQRPSGEQEPLAMLPFKGRHEPDPPRGVQPAENAVMRCYFLRFLIITTCPW